MKNLGKWIVALGVAALVVALAVGVHFACRRNAAVKSAAQTSQSVARMQAAAADPHVLAAAYGRQPMQFEANQGQTDSRVKYLSHGPGYTLFLTNNEAVLSLAKGVAPAAKKAAAESQQAILRMKLEGGNASPQVSAGNPLPTHVNYFIGNDPSKWHSNIPTYSQVAYRGVYPGVDEIFYGNQQQLEYDFVVAPGADPGQIAMRLDGARRISAQPDGSLKIAAGGGAVELRAPVIYQTSHGQRTLVAGGYDLVSKNEIRFRVKDYDHSRQLVIDPELAYSTFLGGSSEDQGLAGTIDSSGDLFVAGFTTSTDFPLVNAFQSTNTGAPNGNSVAFVSELIAAGNNLVFSTYLGGSGIPGGNGGPATGDEALGIAVDNNTGNVYVAGQTFSTDFPITSNAYQTINGGGSVGAQTSFLTVLNSGGTGLVYSTYLGGSSGDTAFSVSTVTISNQPFAYIAGATASGNFPTINAPEPTFVSPTFEGFLSKININTAGVNGLVFSTFIGGTGNSGNGDGDEVFGVKADSSGNAYVVGHTSSVDLPVTPGVFQSTLLGFFNDFAGKLNTTGPTFTYLTYVGGSTADEATSVAVNSSGDSFFVGDTFSTNYPVTSGAFQTSNNGAGNGVTNAFMTELNPTATGLVYSSYLGGSGNGNVGAGDIAFGVALDSSGDAYATGQTFSSNFPLSSAIQNTNGALGNNESNVFISEFNPNGSALLFSTYLGGNGGGSNSPNAGDTGWGIAVDSTNAIYVAGTTGSPNFPLELPFQSGIGGLDDAFLAKISQASGTVTASPNPVTIYSPAQDTVASQPVTLTNGTADTVIIGSISITGTNKADFTTSSSDTCTVGGSGIASEGTCVSTINYTPSTANPETAVLTYTFTGADAPTPLVVQLNGAVGAFTVTVNPGTITVTAGSPGTSTMMVQPGSQGFSGTVTLACTGAPSGATCSISPSSVTLTGAGAQPATVSINTTAPGLVLPASKPSHPAPLLPVALMAMAALLGMGLAISRWQPRLLPAGNRAVALLVLVFALLLMGVMTACGNSSGGGGTPSGTYSLTLTGTAGNLAPTTTLTLVVQ